MTQGQTAKFRRALVICSSILLTGCRAAPSFNILGSYFPAWLFCLLIGIVLTFIAHILLRRWNLGEVLNPPILMYSSLTALFTFTVWLLFFRA